MTNVEPTSPRPADGRTDRADHSSQRTVALSRVSVGRFRATNVRGGTLETAADGTADFTPVELLLVAIGGCTGMDVDALTTRRAEPDAFQITVDADKIRDSNGNHLQDIVITFRVAFPDGTGGDAATAVLPAAAQRSHDRLCTVSRTVQLGAQVGTRIES